MAFDMLPAMPPVNVNSQTISVWHREHKKPFFSGNIGGTNVEIISLPYLGIEDIHLLVKSARTVSEFIIRLNSAYLFKGKFLVQLAYRQIGGTVYIYGAQTKLSGVASESSIKDYFKGLVGERDLTYSEFDRHRVLADLKAKRLGVSYGVSYQVDPQLKNTVLTINEAKTHPQDRHQFSVEVSNQGNRFVGREFGGGSWRYWSSGGAEFSVSYLTSIAENSNESESSYNAFSFSADSPTTYGLYGFDVTNVEYSKVNYEKSANLLSSGCALYESAALCDGARSTVLGISAGTSSISLKGEQILFSGRGRRVISSEQVSYIQDSIASSAVSQSSVEEKYAVAEVGLKFAFSHAAPFKAEGQLFLNVISGTGDVSFVGENSDEIIEFFQVEPSVFAKVYLSPHIALSFHASAKESNAEAVPKQYQYVLGGMNKLSAFLPGVIMGDSGTYSQIALSRLYSSSGGFKMAPAIFIERGAAWFEGGAPDGGVERSILDGGLRVNMAWGNVFEIQLVAASPLSSDNLSEKHLKSSKSSFFGRATLRF